MMRSRLRTKFIIGFSGLILLFCLLLLLLITAQLRNAMKHELRKRGVSIARHLAEASITPILTENLVALQGILTDYTKNENDIRYIYLVNNRREVLAHSFGTIFPGDLLKTDGPLPSDQTVMVTTVDTGEALIKDVAVAVQAGALGRVHVGMSLQVVNDSLRELLLQLLPFAALLLGLGSLTAFAVAASITSPLAELADASNRFAQGQRDVQVALRSQDEIGELATAFNRMTHELAQQQHQLEALNQSLEQRIEHALQELRQRDQALIAQNRLAAMGEMINNIAHQWRQPLNNIGLIVQNMKCLNASGELTQQELAQDVDSTMEQIQFMSRTIDDFRTFFRQDKQKQRFSINQAVARTVALLAPSLSSHNIAVKIQQQGEVETEGYLNEYAHALLNIIANAKEVLVAREVSGAIIELAITQEAERSVVTVSDNAGGIPAEVLPKIFDPYFTTKHQAHGTGIGLYMAKVIIEQNMGGSLTACNTEAGASFRLEL